MSEDIQSVDILQLIPQRSPFVMVDRLTHFDEEETVTELTIRGDNIFVEDGVLTAPGLIENIAQTCATRIGYINWLCKQRIRLGFIGGIKDLRVLCLPPVGSTVTTRIHVREEVFQMTLVDAEVTLGSEVMMTAEMKIALSDIDAQDKQP